jgi:hypothetical protein
VSERALAGLWRALAVALLAALAVPAVREASVVIDGVRYFWLDDDEMVSMRYARNLAEGQGLVWNPGERVEGYTNLLWTLLMAAVHRLGLGDARSSLVLKVACLLMVPAILRIAEELLRSFVPQPGLALPALLVPLVLCRDLLFWAVNGFETTLSTLLFLWVLLRLLQERDAEPRPATFLLLSLIPLVRSDGLYVWASAALLALGLSRKRTTLRLLSLSLLPALLHVAFRYQYYGELLPNTYYLKLAGVGERTGRGLHSLHIFAHDHGALLLLAVAGAVLIGRRELWLLLAGLPVAAAYSVAVGGDTFEGSRFLAHLVPLLFALAAASLATIGAGRRGWVRAALSATFAAMALAGSGVRHPGALLSRNGHPRAGTIAGVMISRHARPEATIAVFAAGAAPYFSHRRAFDMLGKTDAVLAHRPAVCCPEWIGHNKFDPAYSLGAAPDLVLPLVPDALVQSEAEQGSQQRTSGDTYYLALLASPVFRAQYRSQPVALPYLLENGPIYVRSASPERAGLAQWKMPQLED